MNIEHKLMAYIINFKRPLVCLRAYGENLSSMIIQATRPPSDAFRWLKPSFLTNASKFYRVGYKTILTIVSNGEFINLSQSISVIPYL